LASGDFANAAQSSLWAALAKTMQWISPGLDERQSKVMIERGLGRCRIEWAVTAQDEVYVGDGWKAAALPRMAALRVAA